MGASCAVLVPLPPFGPRQHRLGFRHAGPDQPEQQLLHLGHGQRNQLRPPLSRALGDPRLPEPGPRREIGPHTDHVTQPVPLDGCAELVVYASAQRRPSPSAQPDPQRPVDHAPGQHDCGGQRDRLRNAGASAAPSGAGPLLGPIQGAADERPFVVAYPGAPRVGRPRCAPRCPSTGAPRRTTWCPSSGTRSRPRSAPAGASQGPCHMPEPAVPNGVRIPIGPGQQVQHPARIRAHAGGSLRAKSRPIRSPITPASSAQAPTCSRVDRPDVARPR
ncbi:unnamed protein product [Gemmata massiliana]|uniref:Uncharacterized protein n=1 Tax=Gemmata massiliana TaxID=1210884 RepID=A0A6P2D2C3_9BACT|nr:unnamed protein product [Gemmata massiliana]